VRDEPPDAFATGAVFTDPATDGEILIEAGDDRRVAPAGDVAVLPRDQVHTFIVGSGLTLDDYVQ